MGEGTVRPPGPGQSTLDYARPSPPARGRSGRVVWIVLGSVLGLYLLYVGVMIPSGLRSRPQTDRAICANNLRQVALACIQYANENGGRFPPTVNDILLTQEITSEVFVCPASNDTRADGPSTQAVAANLTAGGHLSYVYVGAGKTANDPNAATTVLLYESTSNHVTQGVTVMNVVYADAHIETHEIKAGRKIIAELSTGHNPPRAEKIR